MKTLRRLFLTASLAVAACGVASANSIVQSFTAPISPETDATDWTQIFNTSIQQYNLGPAFILNDIKIEINSSGTATGAATNANDNGGTTAYTFQGITKFLVSNDGSNDGSLLFGSVETDMPFNTSFGTLMTASVNNSVDYVETFDGSGGFVSCSPVVSGGLSSNPLTCGLAFGNGSGPSINMASYVGNGFVPFDLGGQTRGGFAGGSFTNSSLSGTADMIVTVTYDYSIAGAPEPATMGLVGGALVALGLVGRRFRKKTN
jgi:hypothetical protein